MRPLLFLAPVVLLACASTTGAPPGTAPATPETTPEVAPPPGTLAPVAPAPLPPAETEAPKPDDPFAALPPSLPLPATGKPAPVKRSGGKWPFHAWTRAEVVVSNWEPYGPQTKMHAYDQNGWSPSVKYRAPLDDAKAKKAVDTVLLQHGEMLVSKCPAPRHSVVLFDGDVPVASVDVCFTCHDVLLWPKWPGGEPTEKQYAFMTKVNAEFLPRWEALLIHDEKLPLFPGH